MHRVLVAVGTRPHQDRPRAALQHFSRPHGLRCVLSWLGASARPALRRGPEPGGLPGALRPHSLRQRLLGCGVVVHQREHGDQRGHRADRLAPQPLRAARGPARLQRACGACSHAARQHVSGGGGPAAQGASGANRRGLGAASRRLSPSPAARRPCHADRDAHPPLPKPLRCRPASPPSTSPRAARWAGAAPPCTTSSSSTRRCSRCATAPPAATTGLGVGGRKRAAAAAARLPSST